MKIGALKINSLIVDKISDRIQVDAPFKCVELARP